jgi:hypothetical protein
MDNASRAYYGVMFERNYFKMRGDEFQNFFADLMEKRYPRGDFIRVRPWGNIGDRKNDGYIKSKRTLFQVYAPNEMTEANAIKKIDEDFMGALPYWEKYFDTWIFMHNAWKGLGPGITEKLLDLDHAHKQINVTSWGLDDLKKELFLLHDEDIQDMLGIAPTWKDFLQIGFEDLKPILQQITQKPSPKVPDLRQVPRNKIEINKLSDATEALINLGRLKSALVGEFFEKYPSPEYGDQVVEAFRVQYETLKNEDIEPDKIFLGLQIFAGGELTQEPKHQAAILSVLAYLFDECDIFERERKEKP